MTCINACAGSPSPTPTTTPSLRSGTLCARTQPSTRSAYIQYTHRRRIKTEEKAKVVAAIWGTEFIQLLAALGVFHQDDMKKRMFCTRMIRRKG